MTTAPRRACWWLAVAAGAATLKLALVRAQPLYAIGNAAHDEALFLRLARSIAEGSWLGAYDQFTLAKGAVYPAFVAANHYLGLPLRLTEQLLYVGACALVARALAPLLAAGWARLAVFLVLLWNPLTFEGLHMTRVLRQHLTVPLALVVLAALAALALRRDRPFRARLPWAVGGGLSLGLLWNTREEGAWILPAVGLLGAWAAWDLWRGTGPARRAAAGLVAAGALSAAGPFLAIAGLNARHYGWFGTNEFQAADFRAAYGALARIQTEPRLPWVPVSREAREAAYAVSPAFATLRPHLEGEVGWRWADRERFRAEERQIAAGWFMWALRDAVAAAGHAPDAAAALRFYRQVADEVNRACEEGRIPAASRRSGFFPRWHPAYAAALRAAVPYYVAGMFDLSTFEPAPPFSIGTDDEVRLFRDLTHDRISPSLRATHIELPEQRRLDARKLAILRETGRALGPVLAALVLLAHGLLLARVVQLMRARRIEPGPVLAAATWVAAAGALAVNVLVHALAFANFYPAAYAPAYALFLLFGALVAVDSLRAWGPRAGAVLSGRPALAWAVGLGLVVLGARLREAGLFGGEMPFLDQWKVEAEEILGPWVRGELEFAAFLRPHHEHVPLWTRLLAWLQAVLLGTWDPRVQMAVNAGLHAAWVGMLAAWFRDRLAAPAATAAAVLVVALAVLPHAWENITWGFQSQFPLCLLAALVFIRGSFESPPGSRRWWIAQAAGAAGLFTLGSFWAIPLVVCAVAAWTAAPGRRRWLMPLALGGAGLGLFALAVARLPDLGAGSLRSGGVREFLHVWLHFLGWPSALPAAAILINLPLLVWTVRLRGAATAATFDRSLLALGIWAAVNCAGIAYARGAIGADFVARYSDLFAVDVVANGVVLLRLAASHRAWLPVGTAWLAAVALGLHTLNTTGHTAYFHAHAAARAEFRRAAVAAYVQQGDLAALASESGKALVYPDAEAVRRLLDDPRLVRLLPESVLGGATDVWTRTLMESWPLLVLLGLGLAGRAYPRLGNRVHPPPATGRPPFRVWLVIGATAAAAAGSWPRPFSWDSHERRQRLLLPADAIPEFALSFTTPSRYPPERLFGAAALWPEATRNIFSGTHIDGPDFTGTVRSGAFTVQSPWVVVPVSGYPTSRGNHVRLVDAADPDRVLAELRGAPAAPAGGVGFLSAATDGFRGRQVRLELVDGGTDEQGWVAVAPPRPATRADDATQAERAWRAERTLPARTGLAALAGVAFCCAAHSFFGRRRAA